MQKNEYFVAKIGVDTAENEPLQVWGVIQFNIQFPPAAPRGRAEVPRGGQAPVGREEPREVLLMTIFDWIFEIGAVRRNANLVDLEKCRKMTI